ncbi:MAG: alcohol dehydrogenase catalytic domain-containing protein [Planctomycetota bacterium]|jgi:L-iditol 2-dehydrogenase|nr:alcohol dehydrogenase catalytic domain-containing protein [Planctomycetota bacterium]
MTEEMRAVVAHGPKDYRLIRKPVPRPGRGELLMKVAACGICGSDLHAYRGAPYYWGDGTKPGWMRAPVTPGHEFSGVVEEIDAEASQKWGVDKGDPIVVEQILPCWECEYCREGDYHLCAVHTMYGFQKGVTEGAWAEYCLISSRSLVYRIPDGLETAAAATVEPLACAVNAFQTGSVRLSDVVVVAGMGTIGGFIVQLARLANPKLLVVVDVMENRLDLARRFGADVVVNAAREDAVKKVLDLTNGYGCHVYYEVSGHPSGVVQGLEMIRKKGRFVEFSVFGSPVTADWSVVGDKKAMSILGAHISPHTYPVALELLRAGKVKTEGMITGKFPLADFDKALEKAADTAASLKVLLLP